MSAKKVVMAAEQTSFYPLLAYNQMLAMFAKKFKTAAKKTSLRHL